MSHFGRAGPPDISDTYSILVLNISSRTTADDLSRILISTARLLISSSLEIGGVVAGLLVQNTLKFLLNFGNVSPYLVFTSTNFGFCLWNVPEIARSTATMGKSQEFLA